MKNPWLYGVRLLSAPLLSALLLSTLLLSAPPLPGPATAAPLQPIEQIRPNTALLPPGANPCAPAAIKEWGGTRFNAPKLRWEAIPGGLWTFDSGVASTINLGSNPNKPIGYHNRMEGWVGVDMTLNPLPYFRRTGICAIAGLFSLHAGVNAAEAAALCYASGAGYGNSWDLAMGKTFPYAGGDATLTYDFATAAEPEFDFGEVLVESASLGRVRVARHTGSASGTNTIQLRAGVELPLPPEPVTILFRAVSDAAYSDEDGAFDSACGLFTVDNVTLAGAIVDVSTFEAGPGGWSPVLPLRGVGDFSDLVRLTDLPPTGLCNCSLSDSVLIFRDTIDGHPEGQDNLAMSPWIDLAAGGAVWPGKYVKFDYFMELPFNNYIFLQIATQCISPTTCPPLAERIRRRLPLYHGTSLWACSEGRQVVDLSDMIRADATDVRVGFGVVNLCSFYSECSGVQNTTPWIDNVSFGAYDPGGPVATLRPSDMLQDNFASDGLHGVNAPARVDMSRTRGDQRRPASLGDTLVVRATLDAATIVSVIFRVHPGPGTSLPALTAWATDALGGAGVRWLPFAPAPAIWFGSSWYIARMDEAEFHGYARPGYWMSTVHEAQIFPPAGAGAPPGWDKTPDPDDPGELAAEIFPDHILTPGSRIEYYFQVSNGGPCPWLVPNVPAEPALEMEVLPSSATAGGVNNCLLYVDHHHGDGSGEQVLEEAGLTGYLGLGGANVEGTRYDRFDLPAGAYPLGSFARPVGARFGASLNQAYAYSTIVWHSGDQAETHTISEDDADLLYPWMTVDIGALHQFWGSGDNLSRGMFQLPRARTFMQTVLGARHTCTNISFSNCPATTFMDLNNCRPLIAVAGADFTTGLAASLAAGGCPKLRGFDLLSLSPGTSKGQVAYLKAGLTRNYASVTNVTSSGVPWASVIDGFAIGAVREAAVCGGVAPSLDRTASVLNWFAPTTSCAQPPGSAGTPGRTGFETAGALWLGFPSPNPMTGATRISLHAGKAEDAVTVRVFDVAGRVVRTLHTGPLAAGEGELEWDGRSENGLPVTAGIYFIRVLQNSDARGVSRRLVVVR